MLIGISVLWKGLTGFKLIVFDWDGIRKPGSWPTSVWPSRIWVSNRPAMRLHVISLNLASSKPWPGFNPRPATRSWAESPTTIGFNYLSADANLLALPLPPTPFMRTGRA